MKSLKIVFSILIVFVFISGGCKDEFKNKKEARGIWMSRFDYTNKEHDPEKTKADILSAFTNAKQAKFNMIFFQVRGNGDAFYRSGYEPWSRLLTGTFGKDPGWDPLQYAVETAHSLGLELHAWVNTFPAWRANEPNPTETTPRHMLLEHPEWVVCDKEGIPMKPADGYISASPGNPRVRAHIEKVVMDIVNKYDIDGIHFDYIRYPEGSSTKGYSNDKASVAGFNTKEGNPNDLNWADWQRSQVTEFVKSVYTSINTAKPWVKMSAAVIGNYKKGGWNGYNIVYQDAEAWMKESKIDFIVPMTYLKLDNAKTTFGTALEEWKSMLKMRNVYPGLAAYKATDGKDAWGWEMIWNEIKLARETGFPGIVFFAMSNMKKVWETVGETQFPYYANAPSFKHKISEAPEKVSDLVVEKGSEGKFYLRWKKVKNDKNNQPHYYNIYRSTSGTFNEDDSENLIYITAPDVSSFIDKSTSNEKYYYRVSALNRNNIEGRWSERVSNSNVISFAR